MSTHALARALRKDPAKSRVPVPWDSLSGIVHPLRGNLIIVLGSPGIGKSALALNWLLSVDLPSLMLSLDTDLTTQGLRAASISGNQKLSDVEKDPSAWATLVEKKAQLMRVYDLGLEAQELVDLVKAETEYWGEAPAYTVVDNVSNLLRDGGYEEHRNIFLDLHRVARLTDTCIIALHHVKRNTNSNPMLSLHSGQYAGEQEAEVVLGLWAKESTDEFLRVSVLKNRSGKAASDGSLNTPLMFNKDTMQIREPTFADKAMAHLGGRL